MSADEGPPPRHIEFQPLPGLRSALRRVLASPKCLPQLISGGTFILGVPFCLIPSRLPEAKASWTAAPLQIAAGADEEASVGLVLRAHAHQAVSGVDGACTTRAYAVGKVTRPTCILDTPERQDLVDRADE